MASAHCKTHPCGYTITDLSSIHQSRYVGIKPQKRLYSGAYAKNLTLKQRIVSHSNNLPVKDDDCFYVLFCLSCEFKKSILDTFIVMTVLDIFGNPYQKLAHVNV